MLLLCILMEAAGLAVMYFMHGVLRILVRGHRCRDIFINQRRAVGKWIAYSIIIRKYH